MTSRKNFTQGLQPRPAPEHHGIVANTFYDPATPDMGALFIAQGPSFRRGQEFADVDNIDVHNLFFAALGLKPAPNDGDDWLVREALAR